jgi:hypothetical protein
VQPLGLPAYKLSIPLSWNSCQAKNQIFLDSYRYGDSIASMTTSEKDPAAVALGRKGGEARARNLTAEQRRRIAVKAARAAAVIRTRKARQKKQKEKP